MPAREIAKATSHWLQEIDSTLDKINVNLEGIDTNLNRIGDKLD
jgi:hypothetical protein